MTVFPDWLMVALPPVALPCPPSIAVTSAELPTCSRGRVVAAHRASVYGAAADGDAQAVILHHLSRAAAQLGDLEHSALWLRVCSCLARFEAVNMQL